MFLLRLSAILLLELPKVSYLHSYASPTSLAGPTILTVPCSNQMTRLHISRIWFKLWETNSTVVPPPIISIILLRLFSWNAASPTARISSEFPDVQLWRWRKPVLPAYRRSNFGWAFPGTGPVPKIPQFHHTFP